MGEGEGGLAKTSGWLSVGRRQEERVLPARAQTRDPRDNNLALDALAPTAPKVPPLHD